jgi:hypothetical protein
VGFSVSCARPFSKIVVVSKNKDGEKILWTKVLSESARSITMEESLGGLTIPVIATPNTGYVVQVYDESLEIIQRHVFIRVYSARLMDEDRRLGRWFYPLDDDWVSFMSEKDSLGFIHERFASLV